MDRMPQHFGQRPHEHVHAQKASQRSTPTSFPSFAPPSAQPPVQIPFSDPFQTRDPFHPASQHHRSGSYGNLNGAPAGQYGVERAWPTASGQQQPPQSNYQPPHQTSNGQSHMSVPFDSARRRSLGAAASPPRYIGGPLEPPPPPTFTTRNMPPPSPPSIPPPTSSFAGPAPRGPPTASPFTGVRDFSGFSSRPGGGMSISSLIGGDSGKQVDRSPRTHATAPSPTFKPISSHSPQRARSSSNRSEYAYTQRLHSPTHLDHAQLRAEEMRPSAVGHEAHQAFANHTPASMAQSQYAPPNAHMFRPYQSSPSSATGELPLPNGHQAPPRPSSQPVNNLQQEREQRERLELHERGQFPAFRHFNEPPSFRQNDQHHSHQGPESVDQPGQSNHGLSHGHGSEARRVHTPDFSASGRLGAIQPRPGFGRAAGTPLREEYHGVFRPAFHPPQFHNDASARDMAESRGLHSFQVRQDNQASPTPSESSNFDARSRLFGPSTHAHQEGGPTHEQHARRDVEDISTVHRSFLGISPELGRKSGRGSPLPQAVQGAQPRLVGPGGRDPSIKHEFGRMFSGLGSGVGGSSTPTASFSAHGAATPSRSSPARFLNDSDAIQSTEVDVVRNSSTGARNVKKSAGARETVEKGDSDSAEGRNTPAISQRGAKRAKTSHATHHHHHHPHAHQHHHHHHHHHNIADDISPHTGSPFSTIRFPPNPNPPQQGSAATAAHHHHHHHANPPRAPHHHHYTTKTLAAKPTPSISVTDKDLLDSVKHLPRLHLGSALYTSIMSLPANKRTMLDAKFAFDSTPEPIPRFEGKANCTFNVRVPRAYLPSSDGCSGVADLLVGGLEEICKRRALWGTGVYTDDSDVVAAAVHDGWLRGDFGDYNEDLHDLFDEGEEEKSPGNTSLSLKEKPRRPVRPPPNMDMHITLLLLPALQTYASTTMNNIHSRLWGSDHDGMSYKVLAIDFVDEPRSSRFSERTPAARRLRMKDDIRRRREAAEGLMGVMSGVRGVPVGA